MKNIFSHLKKKNLNILELGSHEGKGIAGFFYFFPNANFYGANINPFQMRYVSKRISELYVDVSSEKTEASIRDVGNPIPAANLSTLCMS